MFIQKIIGYPFPLSGWKLHVYGESENDSFFIYDSLKEELNKNQLSSKLATQDFFIKTKGKEQGGKALVIYLNPQIFKSNNLERFLINVKSTLEREGYEEDGQIFGSRKIFNSVYYRYQLNVQEKREGFHELGYNNGYRKNDGQYNIEGNPDPFLSIKI